MAIGEWSTTAADNDDADAAINWLEGQAPSTVNNSARAMMQQLKRWYNEIAGGTVFVPAASVGGTADAITLTTDQTNAMALGQRYMFIAEGTNTGAVTINKDGEGATALNQNGTALSAGAIQSGEMVIIAHDGTDFELVLPNRGSFVGQSLFDANTALAADSDNTPTARTIGEGQVFGRLSGGNIKGVSATELATLLGCQHRLTTLTPAGSATTTSYTSFPATAKRIVVKIAHLRTTSAGTLTLRVTQSATPESGATDYEWCNQFQSMAGSSSFLADSDGSDSLIDLHRSSASVDTTHGLSIRIVFEAPNGTGTFKHIYWEGTIQVDSADSARVSGSAAYIGSTTAIDGFEITGSSNVTGTLDVYAEY